MSKGGMRRWGIVGALALALGAPPVARASRPPDVVLILVDTLRADHLSLYGYSRPTSRHLDAFARSALVFDRALSTASWTLPAVGSLFTGMYPSVHGLQSHYLGPLTVRSLRPEVKTLAELYKERGYYTAAVIANAWLSTETGTHRGFDYYIVRHGMRSPKLNELAKEALTLAPDRPVFLYIHYMDPHGPYDGPAVPPGVLGPVKWADRKLPAPALPHARRMVNHHHKPWAPDEGTTVGFYIDAYDRTIYGWDQEFGKLMDWFRTTRRFERSIIAVTADHGEELYERGGWSHGTTLFQEQTHIPWVLRLPHGRRRGRIGTPVSLIDVAPTLLAASGIPVPPAMQGVNVLDRVPKRRLFAEVEACRGNWGACRQRAVWEWPRKLLLFRKRLRTYDLAADPGEQHPGPPDRDLALALQQWEAGTHKRALALGRAAPRRLDAATRERLRALGYGGAGGGR